jgi:hypothetical protein
LLREYCRLSALPRSVPVLGQAWIERAGSIADFDGHGIVIIET